MLIISLLFHRRLPTWFRLLIRYLSIGKDVAFANSLYLDSSTLDPPQTTTARRGNQVPPPSYHLIASVLLSSLSAEASSYETLGEEVVQKVRFLLRLVATGAKEEKLMLPSSTTSLPTKKGVRFSTESMAAPAPRPPERIATPSTKQIAPRGALMKGGAKPTLSRTVSVGVSPQKRKASDIAAGATQQKAVAKPRPLPRLARSATISHAIGESAVGSIDGGTAAGERGKRSRTATSSNWRFLMQTMQGKETKIIPSFNFKI